MPLKKGSGRSAVSSNIKTLVNEWEKDGAIGTSHPLTKKKAIKQAVAIAKGDNLAENDLEKIRPEQIIGVVIAIVY